MKKLITISSKEALLIQSAVSHWAVHCNKHLNSSDKNIAEMALDDLDLCDNIRRKICKVFTDLSIID